MEHFIPRVPLATDKKVQIKARVAVMGAVQRGELPRATMLRCVCCGDEAHHYHHESYAPEDWLTVVPLCAGCHITLHRVERIQFVEQRIKHLLESIHWLRRDTLSRTSQSNYRFIESAEIRIRQLQSLKESGE